MLEIGCGAGRNLIRAARLYPKARFYGVEISAVMLDEAKASISRNKVAAPIVLAQGDAANLDPGALFGQPRFDRIFISYALSMIPAWRETIAHALDLLRRADRCISSISAIRPGCRPGFASFWPNGWGCFTSLRARSSERIRGPSPGRGLVHKHEALYRGYAFLAVAGFAGDAGPIRRGA